MPRRLVSVLFHVTRSPSFLLPFPAVVAVLSVVAAAAAAAVVSAGDADAPCRCNAASLAAAS